MKLPRVDLSRTAKAVAGFLAPTLTSVAAQIEVPNPRLTEVGKAAVLGTITALTVWAVPNKDA